MKNKVFLLILTTVMMLLTGCATMMHGTTQKIGISSNPSCAGVWIDNHFVGDTPLCVDLKRRCDHVIRIELEGYYPYEIQCSRTLSGWVFGNLAFGGVLGFCVDIVSGGIYCLTPDQVNACLKEDNMMYSRNENSSYIGIVMQPDPSWNKVGQLKKMIQN
ncbi:PEGA domain-containing protein [Waddlia chondrophila]|uniref:PEGA domain-containing protein n=2 Tax=Waddlia chondrophila TaxID=71667 RepID=D6YTV0_WADCW|nr:PEGA domain-containing protein [Waddlia chondrophila]ADI37561.1 conserved hypothetical protein [Waddlia chondrophila WSU 86-1044]